MYLHWANELSTVVAIFFSPCLASLTSHFPLAVTAEETNDESGVIINYCSVL